jgi:ribonuclease D
MSVQAEYIDTTEALAAFCEKLAGAPWLALDTEFLREKTYYPKFCLLQIAAGEQVACIDPLALPSLEPLASLLYDENIVKVLHSGRQDLEIFHLLYGRPPAPLFDTQLAAPLLGMNEQIGYAALVQEVLGVHLGKTHSRTDWSRRPLSAEQLTYAADDAIYLGQVYEKIRPQLESMGRLAWLAQDFAELANPETYRNPPELAWRRIGGVQQLKSKPLSVLQALAAWREDAAREMDLPRGWIVKDEALLDIARRLPKSVEDIKDIRGLPERMLQKHGAHICKLAQAALQKPPQTLEMKRSSGIKSADREALLDLLQAVVRLRAAENALNPSILAGRKDLEQLLDGEGQARMLSGWRKSMAGDELAAILRGELSLSVIDGAVKISAHG